MKNAIDRCTKCVLSASFPKIDFDDKGVCNFCRDKMFFISEDKAIEQSREKILKLISEKKDTSEYDAIMCYSGGKDSTYTLMLAVRKYGLKILSFVLDNGFISPTAFENIDHVVDTLGVDHLTYKPSAKFLKQVIQASALHQIYTPKTLTRISSICNSCISLVNIASLRLAIEKNIPFILAGFTLGQIPSNAILYKNNYRFLQESREASLNNLEKYVGKSVEDYYYIKESTLETIESYPYSINLLCLENVSEGELIENVKALGWKRPKNIDGCSTNCLLNTFNNLVHKKTLGYHPYELELSHLIRKGQLDRDEALQKMDDQPEDQLKNIMEKLDIREEDIGKTQKESLTGSTG